MTGRERSVLADHRWPARTQNVYLSFFFGFFVSFFRSMLFAIELFSLLLILARNAS